MIIGWSLGGMLSLEVASVLARSSDIRVIGIVMMDSINPLKVPKNMPTVVPYQIEYSGYARKETRELVTNCMKLAVGMASNWIPPVWKDCTNQDLIEKRKELEKKLGSRMPAQYGSSCSITELDVPWRDIPPPVPQTVLLRCNEYVPVGTAEDPDAIARVDVVRKQEKLGWEDYNEDMIIAVLDIPGHHYNIFANPHVSALWIPIVATIYQLMVHSD